jgi:hypothetical protein
MDGFRWTGSCLELRYMHPLGTYTHHAHIMQATTFPLHARGADEFPVSGLFPPACNPHTASVTIMILYMHAYLPR